jgi:replicative DNA helicase
MVQQDSVKLIVVDDIGHVNARGCGFRIESRQEELTYVANSMKNLARELGIPIIVVSQLNDQGKLFGARTIGHEADCVWRLKINKKGEESPATAGVPILLEILKQRNGPTGKVDLVFLKEFTRFETAAKPSESAAAEQSLPYHD